MNKSGIFFIFLLLSFIASQTMAEKPMLVTGLATLSCGKTLSEIKTENKIEIAGWINGYITGYNYYNPENRVTPPENETIIAFIDNYCSNNPLDNIISGSAAIVYELGGKKTPHNYKK